MGIWDGYYEDKTLAGVDIVRGGKFPTGLYHVVSEIIVRHADGSFLVTKRDYAKESHAGEWEIGAGGSVLKGEGFYDAAVRELFEETGIRAEKLEKIYEITKVHENGVGVHFIGYLCVTDMDKNNVVLQKGETIDFKWISEEDIVEGDYIPQRKAEYAVKIINDNGGIYEN
ncbi:MAG: NUDIX hydrolase [Ruminococcus sp.]|nr:NUDIX hydrolase [Ruminococcus sp.]